MSGVAPSRQRVSWRLLSLQRRAAENLRINHQYQVNVDSLGVGWNCRNPLTASLSVCVCVCDSHSSHLSSPSIAGFSNVSYNRLNNYTQRDAVLFPLRCRGLFCLPPSLGGHCGIFQGWHAFCCVCICYIFTEWLTFLLHCKVKHIRCATDCILPFVSFTAAHFSVGQLFSGALISTWVALSQIWHCQDFALARISFSSNNF